MGTRAVLHGGLPVKQPCVVETHLPGGLDGAQACAMGGFALLWTTVIFPTRGCSAPEEPLPASGLAMEFGYMQRFPAVV